MKWALVWESISHGSLPGLGLSLLLGSILGSFANVVIWRLPRGQSLIRPGSHCPDCQTPIPLWRNVPLLSFLLLKGRSACCGQPIGLRYPLVELLGALVLGMLYLKEGWTLAFLFKSTWMILLLILAAIDLEHYRLPNSLVIVGALISLLWLIVNPHASWSQAGLGLLVASIFALLMLSVGKAFAGRWGGLGDAKLTVVLGFTFGPWLFLLLYITALFLATIYGALRQQKVKDRRLPLGPFFALGAWSALWSGDSLIRWYLHLWK